MQKLVSKLKVYFEGFLEIKEGILCFLYSDVTFISFVKLDARDIHSIIGPKLEVNMCSLVGW